MQEGYYVFFKINAQDVEQLGTFFTLQNINHELQNETVKMDYRVQCTCIDLEPQKSYLLTQTINYAVFLTIKTNNYGK